MLDPAPAERLPVELIERFLNFIGDDKDTLLHCSRVLRSWREVASPRLFRAITIDPSPENCSAFLRAPESFPPSYLVKHVEIVGSGPSEGTIHPAFHSLLKSLAGLESVTFTRCNFSYIRGNTNECIADFQDLARALHQPSVIVLRQTTYFPLPLLGACPNVEQFEAMDHNKLIGSLLRYVPEPVSSCMKMKGLELAGLHNIKEMVVWLNRMPVDCRFSELRSLHLSDGGLVDDAISGNIGKLVYLTSGSIEELGLNLCPGASIKTFINPCSLRGLEGLKRLSFMEPAPEISSPHTTVRQLKQIGNLLQKIPQRKRLEEITLAYQFFVEPNSAEVRVELLKSTIFAWLPHLSPQSDFPSLSKFNIELHFFGTCARASPKPKHKRQIMNGKLFQSLRAATAVHVIDHRPDVT